MTDAKKIEEIHARTRPSSHSGDDSPGPKQEWDERSLPPGCRVGEFEITGIIGKGGFGIVYLAWDHSLDRVVALKEYIPASFAARTNRTQVNPLSERHRETFQVGLNSFVNEAKLLAQFHSPSLVEVHRFWEDNGTAYMAMPYYRGLTLGATIRSFSGAPSEAWLMELLAPLTEALMELHSVQCYHRDVAPDNILILDDSGAPLLLDFGAARRVIAGQAHALTIILKGGYAPIEQYGEVPGMQQGPWTDVYALASVVYWAVTGKTPPAAPTRTVRDPYVPLAECASPQYSRSFVTAIDRALAVLPEHRTESIAKLRAELGLGAAPAGRTPATIRWSDPDATILDISSTSSNESTRPSATMRNPGTPDGSGAPTPPLEIAPAASARRRLPVAAVGAAAALLIAVAAGVWLLNSDADAPKPPAAVSDRSDSPALPSRPLPKPAPAVAETIPIPQSAADALALILAKKDPKLGVGVDLSDPGLHGGVARRYASYTSSAPGHLYLIGVHPGNDELKLLLPRAGSAPAQIHTSGKVELPVDALKPGVWKLAFIVAREPLDLPSYGWVVKGTAWTRRFAEPGSPGIRGLLPWGIPKCATGVSNCDSGYGALAFELKIEAAPKMAVVKQAPVLPANPVRKAERATQSSRVEVERSSQKSAKAAANPECEKILLRMSLGETGQELIERLKSLKCN